MPGSGHIYLGYFKRGLLFLFLIIFSKIAVLYFWTFYISPLVVIVFLVLLILIYVFIGYDAFKLSKANKRVDKFYNEWIIILLAWIPISFFLLHATEKYSPIRSFVLPSRSMEDTLQSGDYIVALKNKDIKRGDMAIFVMPNTDTYFIKRVVAGKGDEVIYINKQLLIHFKEGESYIKQHYPPAKIVTVDHKLWVVNPYEKSVEIKYTPNYQGNSFSIMTHRVRDGGIAMEARFFKELNGSIFTVANKQYNAFYTRVKHGYFMMGDNRDNSSDSRFYGEIDKKFIFGKPECIYLNVAHGRVNIDRIRPLPADDRRDGRQRSGGV